MTIVITGSGLSIEKLVKVARHNEEITLHPDALLRIKSCRTMLENKIKGQYWDWRVLGGCFERCADERIPEISYL